MIGFYLKKNFCDGWDNLFLLAAVNIICIFTAIGCYFAIGTVITNPALTAAVFTLFLMLIMVFIFAFGKCAAAIAAFKSVTFKDYFAAVGQTWRTALPFGIITAALIILGLIAVPFYLQMQTLFGVFCSALVFWILFIVSMSLQWFIPLHFMMDDPFLKTLKKCFIIFFDNAGFSIFVFTYSLFLTIFSAFIFFIVPSVSGVVLAQTNALRLRMYKYDWMEQHPDIPPKEARRQIPWEELIAEDRETLGPRTLKNLIFPWK